MKTWELATGGGGPTNCPFRCRASYSTTPSTPNIHKLNLRGQSCVPSALSGATARCLAPSFLQRRLRERRARRGEATKHFFAGSNESLVVRAFVGETRWRRWSIDGAHKPNLSPATKSCLGGPMMDSIFDISLSLDLYIYISLPISLYINLRLFIHLSLSISLSSIYIYLPIHLSTRMWVYKYIHICIIYLGYILTLLMREESMILRKESMS